MNRFLKVYDPILLLLASVATAIGLYFILDAGFARSLGTGKGVWPPEFRTQLMLLPVALFAGWGMAFVNPNTLRKLGPAIGALCLGLLLYVHFLGREMNNARRWIQLGSFQFQPSEFAKIGVILFLASAFYSRKRWPSKIKASSQASYWDTVLRLKSVRAIPAVAVLLAALLIDKEKDIGTASILVVVMFAMFIPAKVTWQSVAILATVCLVAGAIMVHGQDYRMTRILQHGNRWDVKNVDDDSYQTNQSELAQATGGVAGVGIGAGRAKHMLPATTTDFIMATIGEECGLLGALAVLAVLGGMVWRLFLLASRAKDQYRMMVLYGVACWLGWQCCVNVMMANATLPAIGIPLPFISSGGSSLIALWMAVGICQAMVSPEKSRVHGKAVVETSALHGAPTGV